MKVLTIFYQACHDRETVQNLSTFTKVFHKNIKNIYLYKKYSP